MKTYTIEIKETLSRIIEVESESIDSAILQIKEMYKNEEIILSADDYLETEFLELENSNLL